MYWPHRRTRTGYHPADPTGWQPLFPDKVFERLDDFVGRPPGDGEDLRVSPVNKLEAEKPHRRVLLIQRKSSLPRSMIQMSTVQGTNRSSMLTTKFILSRASLIW